VLGHWIFHILVSDIIFFNGVGRLVHILHNCCRIHQSIQGNKGEQKPALLHLQDRLNALNERPWPIGARTTSIG
jgi:hypothetical protein